MLTLTQRVMKITYSPKIKQVVSIFYHIFSNCKFISPSLSDIQFISYYKQAMNTAKRSDSSLTHIKSKIKVVFLGDQSTGKTCILLRFMYDKFEEGQGATVGIDFMAKNFTVLNYHLRLQLWDTAGQERFRSLIPTYLKDASIAFIIFDLTNKRSFENVREWIDLCQQNKKQKSVIILVGNKSDLAEERKVSYSQASQLAKSQQISYFEASAKDNTNINQMFSAATEQYVRQIQGADSLLSNGQMELKQQSSIVGQREKIELNDRPITGGPGKSKKKNPNCC